MKRILLAATLLMVWAASAWADSPLTSTDFSNAYSTHPMVEMAGGLKPGSFLPTTLLSFLADKDSPIDVRLAVVNKLGWSFDGNNIEQQLGEYLMTKHKTKTLDKLYKKLDANTLCVYAYSKALSNYFEVDEASRLAHQAVKKDKSHSLSIALIDALIEAQIYLDNDWSKIYPRVANVLHDGSLNLDMRQSAINIIMEYIDLYKKYDK